MELIGKTSIDFLGKRRFAYLFSLLITVASFYIWFARGEDKYDIDFTGGHVFIVKTADDGTAEGVRKAIERQGLTEATVQSFEASSHQFSIKVGGKADEGKVYKEKISEALKTAYAQSGEILQSDFVGPSIGAELKEKALIAVILSLIGIVIYVAFRFEFAFALGALVALAHDVICATGIYLLFGHNINMTVVAAALTILGYSVNDTIVIFDKVREEVFKRQTYDLVTLMNECVNMMLSRTIITGGLTFFSAFALYLLGGGAIADLSLYLTIGVLFGMYSTVFIASPVVFTYESYMRKRRGITA